MSFEPTVFFVDDDAAVRDAVQALLTHAGFAVELYPDPGNFLAACNPQRPGCLLLDVRLPVMSGLVLLKRLRECAITLPAIMLTGHGDVPMAVKAFKHGAVEFLEKPFDNRVLVEALHKAIALDAQARRRDARCRDIGKRLARLTEREREVLDGLVAGQPHKVIAADLGLSTSSIEIHRKQILRKLGAHDRAELLRMVLSSRVSAP